MPLTTTTLLYIPYFLYIHLLSCLLFFKKKKNSYSNISNLLFSLFHFYLQYSSLNSHTIRFWNCLPTTAFQSSKTSNSTHYLLLILHSACMHTHACLRWWGRERERKGYVRVWEKGVRLSHSWVPCHKHIASQWRGKQGQWTGRLPTHTALQGFLHLILPPPLFFLEEEGWKGFSWKVQGRGIERKSSRLHRPGLSF